MMATSQNRLVEAAGGLAEDRFQVVGQGEPPQVTRDEQRHLLPAEGEDEADDQRPLQGSAHEREERPVGGEAERQDAQVPRRG